MKLPSLRQMLQEAHATLIRFPLVLAAAVLGTAAAVTLIERDTPADPTFLNPLLLSSILGIPFLLALALAGERRGTAKSASIGLQLAGVLVLAAYAYTVPGSLDNAPGYVIARFLLLGCALHLLVASLPFLMGGETGFWRFNQTLLLRLLSAALHSAVLFAGLAIALGALDNLFNIHVPPERYFELWVLIVGTFNTWFFLAGIPGNLQELESATGYPKALRIFAQYILIPIVVVYLVILYAYLGKILLEWDWPKGWVSKLILGFSGTGLFSLLLLHPLAETEAFTWVAKAKRWFFIVLVPLVVMLFLAVWRRVSEYGITEGRYLAIALGVWLAFLVLFFTLSRAKSIKVIPASLCLLAFAVSSGPWSAFSVSRQSQIARLEARATAAGIMAGGVLAPPKDAVRFDDAREMSAVLSYLHEMHGYEGIETWFPEPLTTAAAGATPGLKGPETVARMMGFEYVKQWRDEPGGMFTLEPDGAFDPSGYDRLVQLTMDAPAGQENRLPGTGLTYRFTSPPDSLVFRKAETGGIVLALDVRAHAATLAQGRDTSAGDRLPADAMALRASAGGLRVQLCPWQIRADQSEGTVKLQHVRGVLLYSTDGP
jgi:hypothetical protein